MALLFYSKYFRNAHAKETKAATGYYLCGGENACSNSTDGVHKVEVTSDNDEDNPAKVKCSDTPGNDPMGISLYKLDSATGTAYAQGGADLEGAQFTVKYYDGYYNESNTPSAATRTWVIETKYNEYDGQYWATLDDDCKISGDDWYYYRNVVTLPLGTYTIQETKAPTGYLLEGEPRNSGYVAEDAYEAPIHYGQVTLENNVVESLTIGNETDPNEYTAE